jgi:transposase
MNINTLEPEVREYIKKREDAIKARDEEIKSLRFDLLRLKEENALLLYKRFVRSAEKILADRGQGELFSEEETKSEAPGKESGEEEIQEVKSYKRRKPGRKPINPALPRVQEIIDIPEEDKVCGCGEHLTKIGEEVSEKVEITPPKLVIKQTVRPKYACRHCEGTEDEGKPTVRIAPPPPCMIPRSIASESLLSYVIVHKFEDHLPYYRQEKQFERIGIDISRQDMSNWQQQVYHKLLPLFALFTETLKSGNVLQMDETPVLVMGEEGREDTQKSYMWLALGGPEGKKVVRYEYHRTRGAVNVREMLEGFSGYLQTDGYEAYDAALKGRDDIVHVGCFAHARRKFFEASKITKKAGSAEEGIKKIRKLYTIESDLREKNLPPGQFMKERKEQAGPALEQFKAWLEKRNEEVPPEILLGKAIRYSLGQWDKMVRYLESPYLTPDNNACENAIRPFVIGRKNWLFCKSPEGAASSCGMYSLIETARLNGLVPLDYLTALFEKAPLAQTRNDWEKLLPWNIFTA